MNFSHTCDFQVDISLKNHPVYKCNILHLSIKEDRIVLEIPEDNSLIGSSVSGDGSKIAFFYSGLIDPLMLVVVQASGYKEDVKVKTYYV